MSRVRVAQRLRRIVAAAALVGLTGCASYAAGAGNTAYYYDPDGYGYSVDDGLGDGVLAFDGNGYGYGDGRHYAERGLEDRWHNRWQDHINMNAMHDHLAGVHAPAVAGIHGGFNVAHMGGFHGGFGGGHGRG